MANVNFHLVIESGDIKNTMPGDIALMLQKVRQEVLSCQTQGSILNDRQQIIGQWCLDISE